MARAETQYNTVTMLDGRIVEPDCSVLFLNGVPIDRIDRG